MAALAPRIGLAVGDPDRRVIAGRIEGVDLGAVLLVADDLVELAVGEIVQLIGDRIVVGRGGDSWQPAVGSRCRRAGAAAVAAEAAGAGAAATGAAARRRSRGAGAGAVVDGAAAAAAGCSGFGRHRRSGAVVVVAARRGAAVRRRARRRQRPEAQHNGRRGQKPLEPNPATLPMLPADLPISTATSRPSETTGHPIAAKTQPSMAMALAGDGASHAVSQTRRTLREPRQFGHVYRIKVRSIARLSAGLSLCRNGPRRRRGNHHALLCDA